MAEIINFRKKEKSDEELIDCFICSLNETQQEQFFEIVEKAKQEYDTLYQTAQEISKMYIKKVKECEELKTEK